LISSTLAQHLGILPFKVKSDGPVIVEVKGSSVEKQLNNYINF
jgi:hypothetical protein